MVDHCRLYHRSRSSSSDPRFSCWPEKSQVTDKYKITSQGSHSTGHVELELPIALLEEAVSEVASQLPRLKARSVGGHAAELVARINVKTWGSRITVQYKSLDESRTLVEASSRPKVSTTLIDYGQSRDDLRDFFSALERHAAERALS